MGRPCGWHYGWYLVVSSSRYENHRHTKTDGLVRIVVARRRPEMATWIAYSIPINGLHDFMSAEGGNGDVDCLLETSPAGTCFSGHYPILPILYQCLFAIGHEFERNQSSMFHPDFLRTLLFPCYRDRYIWEGSVVDVETYVETDLEMSRAAFIPGIGCTVNSIMDMHNIDSTHGSKYDTAGLNRSKDPGSGAFTPYHHSLTEASEDIPAGSELFAEYGDGWIQEIPGAQITVDVTLDEADDFMMDHYLPFMAKHKDEMTEEMKQALWEFTTKDFPVYNQALTNLPRFPWSEVEAFVENGLKKQDSLDDKPVSIVRHFIRKQAVRSIEWLQDRGYCQDHIKPDISTIPQAGRGAFATRDLPKGTVVGYSPLVHIGVHGREIFDISYNNVGGINEERHTYDLIINYSFGHRNSSMVLTPYGGMVNYINHQSGDKANVKVRWPDRTLVAHKPDWLKENPEFFRDTIEKIGLSFEYVALRDIKKGEEVFMDYGPEWEAAWEEHVKNWKPLEGAENYVHSTEWKEPYLRTFEELEKNPYPSNLQTMCIESFARDEDGSYMFVPVLRDTTLRKHCDVTARYDDGEGGYLYDIDLKLDEDEEESWIKVKGYDSSGVQLYDKPFTADWHMPNTFRHEMAIPDDVMPPAWENGPPEHPF